MFRFRAMNELTSRTLLTILNRKTSHSMIPSLKVIIICRSYGCGQRISFGCVHVSYPIYSRSSRRRTKRTTKYDDDDDTSTEHGIASDNVFRLRGLIHTQWQKRKWMKQKMKTIQRRSLARWPEPILYWLRAIFYLFIPEFIKITLLINTAKAILVVNLNFVSALIQQVGFHRLFFSNQEQFFVCR